MDKHIALIGFMGAGKSTVGEILAARLNLPYYDVDEQVASRSGKTINQIFNESGESRFRELEIESLNHVLASPPGVISTGGGIIMTQDGRNSVRNPNFITVWLQVSFEEAERRVAGDPNRPLFRDVAAAKELFDKRQPLYEQAADIIIDGGQPESAIVEHILTEVNRV